MRHLRKTQLALICVLCTALVLGAYLLRNNRGFGWLVRWELRLRDTLGNHGTLAPPNRQLVYVGIDNDSIALEELDLDTTFADVPRDSADYRALSLISKQWPWPREIYGLMLDKLFSAGARVVVVDLLFPKSSTDDAKFHEALDRYRDRVVIGSNFVSSDARSEGTDQLMQSIPADTIIPQTDPPDPRVAFVNYWRDSADDKVRRACFRLTPKGLWKRGSSEEMLSLAARAVTMAGHPEVIPPQKDADWMFRYTAAPGAGFRPVSAYQLFAPRFWNANFGPDYFRDKIVLIGPSGNWQHDEHETPMGTMAGPELHLNVINALLNRAFLQEAPSWADVMLILLGGTLAWLVSQFSPRPALQILRLIGGNVLGILTAVLLYERFDLYTAMVAPLFAFNLGGGACFVYEFAVERLEKARMRRLFVRYVSKDVVQELLDNRLSVLHAMEGTRRMVTVMFSDLRGFTTLTETADAVALVAQLNEYFQRMVRIVFANGGTLDKFIGDGLMAHWGSIVSEGESMDASKAVRAALQMRAALRELNASWKERGLPVLDFGIGVNSGEAIVGNIGCDEKMEVSIIGDPVNLAARLEGATKQYRLDLLIAEPVARLIGDAFVKRSVDLLRVKGRSRPVEVFTVLSEGEPDATAPEWLQLYQEAVSLYRQRQFSEAMALCEQASRLQPDDWLIEEYLRRAQIYAVQPPGPDWSGVSTLSQK